MFNFSSIQHRLATGLKLIPTSAGDSEENWYPPGHGDIFEMIVRSGVAEKLISEGKEWAFISNIDNPGADLDPAIAQEVYKKKIPLLMEFTTRTPNDRTGGVLIKQNGRVSCLELSQVPDNVLPQFVSLDYSSFHTNNMWIHLPKVVDMVHSRALKLSPCAVLRELGNSEVIQLENVIASILPLIDDTVLLSVPRFRWRVIKTTADLLMVRSEGLLKLHKGKLVIGDRRRIPGLPTIKWGSHFRNVHDLELRIPFPPDLTELLHLSVEGDVRFGKNVKLAGTVILIASGGNRLVIPDNATLRDNIVIGELTITPH